VSSSRSWQQDLRVGIDFIDQEHEILVDTLAHLEEAIFARGDDHGAALRIGLLLERFWAQVTTHFAHEQQAMREQGYPQFEEHLACHDQFLTSLNDLRQACAEGDAGAATRWSVRYLQTWFAHHALTCDTPLARWLDTTTGPTTAPTTAWLGSIGPTTTPTEAR
jgi:hemerythrin